MELNLFKNFERPSWQWLLAIVAFLAFSRLIPHAPNFTPLGAMALLAGACIKDIKFALLIPLLAMLLSDFILGFHSSMIFVYAAMALIVIGSYFWLNKISLTSLALGSVLSAILFFIVTNFGAWLSHDMYSHNLNGLIQAYVAGIPFFKNTLVSTLVFTGIGFIASQQLASKQFANS